MIKIVYLPKNKNLPEKAIVQWDGVQYSLNIGEPILFEEKIAKAILGDWDMEGTLLVEEKRRVKAMITSSAPLDRIFVVIGDKRKNIFGEIENEDENLPVHTDLSAMPVCYIPNTDRLTVKTEDSVRKTIKSKRTIKKNKIKDYD